MDYRYKWWDRGYRIYDIDYGLSVWYIGYAVCVMEYGVQVIEYISFFLCIGYGVYKN